MLHADERIKNIFANLRVIEDWMELERLMKDRDWDRYWKLLEIQQEMFRNLGEDMWIKELFK